MRPYARTKSKTESSVGHVKRNAIADRDFLSFGGLEVHLATWMHLADEREQGTTHESPLARFTRDEVQHLRPLPSTPPARAGTPPRAPGRERLLRRRVDTVRYSVPHRLVRERVEVRVGEVGVEIFYDGSVVAPHRRVNEPYARVVDPRHFEGLERAEAPVLPVDNPLEAMGRRLAEYAAIIGGGA